ATGNGAAQRQGEREAPCGPGAAPAPGTGQPLPPSVRAELEPRFGRSLADVRIHTGSAAATSARRLDAQAYTTGHHIVFDEGQFAPDPTAGRKLIAHELGHVVP